MSVYRLPSGQLISRGYVANFSQNFNEVCQILPRLSKHLPIIIVKKKGQENIIKEVNENHSLAKNKIFMPYLFMLVFVDV
jgi:hypothetical protein